MSVLVNRTRSGEEGQAAFERLGLAASRFLGRELGYLGTLPEDDALRADIRRPGALLTTAPSEVDDAVACLFEPKTPGTRGPCAAPSRSPHTMSAP